MDQCCRTTGCELQHLEMYCAKPKSQPHTTAYPITTTASQTTTQLNMVRALLLEYEITFVTFSIVRHCPGLVQGCKMSFIQLSSHDPSMKLQSVDGQRKFKGTEVLEAPDCRTLLEAEQLISIEKTLPDTGYLPKLANLLR